MQPADARLDLASGIIEGKLTSRRTLADLASLFASRPETGEGLVYETFGCPNQDEADPPVLLYATTVLQPGDVDGECYMTRGHFHTNPERGEICLTLSGEGLLLLMERSGATSALRMETGTVHHISGELGHRVVNTGRTPLVFFVTWMSDCGHDYAAVESRGFGVRVFRGEDQPIIRNTDPNASSSS